MTAVDPAGQRRSYTRGGLDEADLAAGWLEQFRAWYATAQADAGLVEPNACVLATATPDGRPSARTVLLKGVDERGFTIFTNLGSRKATEAAYSPYASMVFPWLALERQVVACGRFAPVAREETEAYARSRPPGSQRAAWTSRQSRPIVGRAALEARRDQVAARFGDDVPVPPFWGGLRLEPVTVEFWQGRPDRLHDRLQYRRIDGGWVGERLQP